MESIKIRKIFLDYFKEKKHKVVPSSSLIPNDSTVLFTTAGMQQFKQYFLKEKSPYGNRVASCQKCFRTSDIDEVGDSSHLTFFEMLGNFSFGDYYKREAIEYALELLIKRFKIPKERLWFTYFKGEGNIPEDKETKEILLDLKIPKERIFGFGKKENFWGPTGESGPCGPSCEIHYDTVGKSCSKGENCLPDCECLRFLEIWNLVFNEYFQDKNGNLSLLEKKGIDTGMGLERLAMVVQNKKTVFETDLFFPILTLLPLDLSVKFSRIIADHIKGAVFLISEGVFPSNIERGYVLRRILRRAIRYGKIGNLNKHFLIPLAKKVIEIYKETYKELSLKENDILTVIQNEKEKFEKTLEKGLKVFEKLSKKGEISGIDAFHLYDTYGFPLELTKELAREKNIKIEEEGFWSALKKHQELSRIYGKRKFGGHGIEDKEGDEEIKKLHTATHLLHSALRKILGEEVKQMGSDITKERLRFDFSFFRKLEYEEIKKIEDLVNKKIKENLKVKREEMDLDKAIKSGALAFFKEKYPERVSVYTIYNPKTNEVFSKEICAGPHVENTSSLGRFKIIKEESVGTGIRRIRAILE